MKLLKRFIKASSVAAFIACSVIWGLIISCSSKVADVYYVNENCEIGLSENITIAKSEKNTGSTNENLKTDAELYLFNLFPIKSVTINRVSNREVVPGGIPFGIKMLSSSVVVAETGYIQSGGKTASPAKDAGIQIADTIVSINGEKMQSNSDVIRAISQSGGKTISVLLKRNDGSCKSVDVVPVKDLVDGEYKIGIWVRDSSAGIGTVTFYDPMSQSFAGLGHAVCDSSSGSALSLLSGDVVMAEIDSVTRSIKGSPGQLNGHFLSNKSVGRIYKNDETGVYGTIENVSYSGQTVQIALKQEIKTGKATILTTLSGNTPEEFEIEIEKISLSADRATKNMVIKVTDSRLLKKAGGIVQGMSGSPILQNGKLVGAVTHVFVNDCTRGYGIFAENMLETAQSVGGSASTSREKDAA